MCNYFLKQHLENKWKYLKDVFYSLEKKIENSFLGLALKLFFKIGLKTIFEFLKTILLYFIEQKFVWKPKMFLTCFEYFKIWFLEINFMFSALFLIILHICILIF